MGFKFYEKEVIELRKHFHMNPELGFEEYETQEFIMNYLTELGLKPEKIAKTGVKCIIEGNKKSPVLMLRADMDALPVEEETGLDFASKNKGLMHACGHDGHMAVLLTTAKILVERKDEINGTVLLAFQPNEEDAGAYLMVEEGILENPKVDGVIGLHLWNEIPYGKISIQEGPVMGAMEIFELTIKGQGGHSSMPYDAIDPIVAASNLVLTLQNIQTRENNALNPLVITIGQIIGGTAPNIIPEQVKVTGTVRYLYDVEYEDENHPKNKIQRIIEGFEKVYRVKIDIDYKISNRIVSNDGKLANLVKKAASKLFNDEDFVKYSTMAGEDFSEYGYSKNERVPYTFYFVGTGKGEGTYPHHHPKFDIDERALIEAVRTQVESVLLYFEEGRFE